MARGDSELLADKPVADPCDDRLGYAPFAKQLADSIMRAPNSVELVYAIYGAWGSGKSTVLQFVEHYLQELPEYERPIIVHFNPWWFSGREDLTRRFLNQLQATVTAKWKVAGRKLINLMANLADLLSEVPAEQAKALKFVSRLLGRGPKDVPNLKGEISKMLRSQRQRILVVVDDLDRLTADEIRDLFRTIKVVADFPNVIYLLAFDKRVVAMALSTPEGISGGAYLEKIVQVSFELPLPEQSSLQDMLSERFDVILAGTPPELFGSPYWINVYYDGLRHFIHTPRNVVQLVNALSTTYEAIKGEVNAVDYIAIQACRVFLPVLYDTIRRNESSFAINLEQTPSDALGDLRLFHDTWLSQVAAEDREAVKRLVSRIFPRVEAVWNGERLGSGWESEWRREYRICSPARFPVYFRLSPPEGSISRAEMMATLALASDADAFGSKLVALAHEKRPDGTTRARQFLEELLDYSLEIPRSCIFPMVSAFFTIGDDLLRPEDVTPGLASLGGNGEKIERIIDYLLTPLSEPDRFTVLHQAIAGARSPATVVLELARLQTRDEVFTDIETIHEDRRFLGSAHLATLKDSALRVIRQAASAGDLLHAPELPTVLRAWTEWGGEAEARDWVRSVTQEDHSLKMFLQRFVRVGFRQQQPDVGTTKVSWLDPQDIASYVDTSHIAQRLANVSRGEIDDQEQPIVEMFRRGYALRQQGKDPNSPTNWPT